MNRVYQCDALTLLRALPSGSVDLILTDPPYGVHEAEWDTAPDLDALWHEFKRILKPRRAVVFTAVQPFTTDLICSNREWFKYCWVWEKSIAGDFFNAKNKPMRLHEDIVVFSNGTTANGSSNRMRYFPQGLIERHETEVRNHSQKFRNDDVQIIKTRDNWKAIYHREYTNYPNSILRFAHGNNFTEHVNQKPVDLFAYLIRTYTEQGDVVIDPYVGSGTTALAAQISKRQFIASDIDPKYCQMGRERLRKHSGDVTDLPLFAHLLDTA